MYILNICKCGSPPKGYIMLHSHIHNVKIPVLPAWYHLTKSALPIGLHV